MLALRAAAPQLCVGGKWNGLRQVRLGPFLFQVCPGRCDEFLGGIPLGPGRPSWRLFLGFAKRRSLFAVRRNPAQRPTLIYCSQYIGVAVMRPILLCLYRGYRIEVFSNSSKCGFSAEPCRPELPILAHRTYEGFSSAERALRAAKERIDKMLQA